MGRALTCLFGTVLLWAACSDDGSDAGLDSTTGPETPSCDELSCAASEVCVAPCIAESPYCAAETELDCSENPDTGHMYCSHASCGGTFDPIQKVLSCSNCGG